MARISGRNGVLLVQLVTSSTALTTISFLRDWSINFSTEQIDVTAMEDSNKTYVSGLADCTGAASGFLDAASTATTYQAAVDGGARSFKILPDKNSTGTFYGGTANFDFSLSSAVAGAVEFSTTFTAAGAVTRTQS
jgi:TP901-1 family phage major tail protein